MKFGKLRVGMAALLMALGAGGAFAQSQEPEFYIQEATIHPGPDGDTPQVKCGVRVRYGPPDTAGVQFTVRIPQEDAQWVNSDIRIELQIKGWEQSQTSWTDASTGDLYLRFTASRPLTSMGEENTLDLSINSLLAEAFFDYDVYAPPESEFRYHFLGALPAGDFAEGSVSVALADSKGVSYVADLTADGFRDPDLERPLTHAEDVNVGFPIIYGEDYFADLGVSPFQYYELHPTVSQPGIKLIGGIVANVGLVVTLADVSGVNSVPQKSFLGVFLPPFNAPEYATRGYFPAYTGKLLASSWVVDSTAATPADSVGYEYSLSTSDTNVNVRSIMQYTGFPGSFEEGASLPYVPGRVKSVLMEVPAVAADGGTEGAPDGLYPVFATLHRPNEGTQGVVSTVGYHQTSEFFIDPQRRNDDVLFECGEGVCGTGSAFVTPPQNPLPGSRAVTYTQGPESFSITLRDDEGASGDSIGYFETTAPLTFPGHNFYSLLRLEVTFAFPDGTPASVPNQTIGIFHAGALDYGTMAEFRSKTEPFEPFGPDNTYTRTTWLMNPVNTDWPLSIVIGVRGNPDVIGAQRVEVKSVKLTNVWEPDPV